MLGPTLPLCGVLFGCVRVSLALPDWPFSTSGRQRLLFRVPLQSHRAGLSPLLQSTRLRKQKLASIAALVPGCLALTLAIV